MKLFCGKRKNTFELHWIFSAEFESCKLRNFRFRSTKGNKNNAQKAEKNNAFKNQNDCYFAIRNNI